VVHYQRRLLQPVYQAAEMEQLVDTLVWVVVGALGAGEVYGWPSAMPCSIGVLPLCRGMMTSVDCSCGQCISSACKDLTITAAR
jgi:hypothetical protein